MDIIINFLQVVISRLLSCLSVLCLTCPDRSSRYMFVFSNCLKSTNIRVFLFSCHKELQVSLWARSFLRDVLLCSVSVTESSAAIFV